ncbi:MAG: AAA family ATPase [Spirochaetes bacterium]|nr:AAA family ATPase [Spirochaetota bacterium]
MHLKRIDILNNAFPATGAYPFSLEVLRRTRGLEFPGPVTFFVGENGSGKSTLLEAICLRCGIHIWRGDERTRCTPNPLERELYRFISHEWGAGPVPGAFFSSNLFQNFARILDEWAASDPGVLEFFGGRSLLTLSHGQSLMSFFRARFAVKGIYLLDEPETALSPKSQIILLRLLVEMAAAGHAQFIIATHSPILLACPGALIYSFDRAPVETVRYRDTEHYRVYRAFMDDTEGVLGRLATVDDITC